MRLALWYKFMRQATVLRLPGVAIGWPDDCHRLVVALLQGFGDANNSGDERD